MREILRHTCVVGEFPDGHSLSDPRGLPAWQSLTQLTGVVAARQPLLPRPGPRRTGRRRRALSTDAEASIAPLTYQFNPRDVQRQRRTVAPGSWVQRSVDIR